MMSSEPKADGGEVEGFAPSVLETEAEIAESLRMPAARNADKVMQVLEETNTVALKLESSWWGNEAFGVWSEWFFVKPDGVSPSGEALFVSKGIAMSDPVGKLRRAESRAESRNGWNSKAVSRAKRKALKNWEDDYMVGPGGGDGMDDRDTFKDGSCPLSVIDAAFRLPEPENDLVFPANGDARRGNLSNGDIYITDTKRTKYGDKAVLSGDTYNALSSQGDNISDEVEFDAAHLSFDGDDWTCDAKGPALLTVIKALNDGGYSVALPESFEGMLNDAQDAAESFDVDI